MEIHEIQNWKKPNWTNWFFWCHRQSSLYRQVLCEPEQLNIRECEKKKTNKILVPSFCERKESS